MKKETKVKFNIEHKNTIQDESFLSNIRITQQLNRMKEDIACLNSAKNSQCSLNQSNIQIKRRQRKLNTNTFYNNFINKKNLGLRKVLQQQKSKSIIKNFIFKLKRNITSSTPVQYYPFQKQKDYSLFNRQGYRIPAGLQLIYSILSIIIIIILVFIYPLQIVFENTFSQDSLFSLEIFVLCFYSIQVCINFLTFKNVQGRKLTLLKDIIPDYLRRKFHIDFLCIGILIIDVTMHDEITKYLRLIILFKLKQTLQKLQKVQNIFIKNFHKQQYWALAKIFFVNFAFAHLLAILLMAMSKLSVNNWLNKLNISLAPWYQQYVWSYYWGTTIMLTVGFGDISPTNYKQAICITIIQTFTCILLAYNINCVGNLINNIRQQDIQKTKNFKIMRRLVEENNVTQDLEFRVCNYIDQSDKMKKKFCFQSEKQFICNLPPQLKADFLKQSNIKIFQNLRFFSSFSQKVLLTLAEKIQVKIAHPEEIIFKFDSNESNFIILRDGKVGYCTKKNGSDFNGTIIDLIQIKKENNPMVLHLNFMFQTNNQKKFEIKSLNYSMIYKISLNNFIQILKNSSLDFQSFCELRDKSKHIIDQYQVIPCKYCPTKHSKMRCPKLHFIPINQKVVYKFLEQVKKGRNQRLTFKWIHKKLIFASPLKMRKIFKKFEEQIYGIKTKKSFSKKSQKFQLCTTKNQEQLERNTQTKRNLVQNQHHIIDENKLAIKIQNDMLCKITQILQQKRTNHLQYFWDLECDMINNFKFYFVGSNGSEINFVIKSILGTQTIQLDQQTQFLKALKTMKLKTQSLVKNQN